jgi:hypothetical protein
MKKLLVGSVLALAVTMASQQTASAWSEFKFSVGFDICYRGGGNCRYWGIYGGRVSAPYPDCGVGGFGPGYGFAGAFPGLVGGYGYADNGSNWQAPAPAAQTAPAAAPQAYSPYFNSGYQPVGYFYPGYSQQTPAYWYGR